MSKTMAEARLLVRAVGPLVSIQDAGRAGKLRYGVCASGPMDRFAYACARAALTLDHGCPVVEVSLGGLTLECMSGEVSLAFAGAEPCIRLDDVRLPAWSVATLRQGQTLSITGGDWGSFSYVSFAGDLQCRRWLGAAATHMLSGLGAGALTAGQELVIHSARTCPDREGALAVPDFVQPCEEIHAVLGPQQACFTHDSVERFFAHPFSLGTAYDRMGVRLTGPQMELTDALSIPSEPVIRGSVQVSGDGVPTVLLADHQTTGGYPKIATVVSVDTDRLVQLRSGQSIRFSAVSPAEAIGITRRVNEEREQYLASLQQPQGNLAYRLMHYNLIDGVVADLD
ncbi:MAG: biotin-dependent carboxyltransferase family protein [Granulosicoccus sp.]